MMGGLILEQSLSSILACVMARPGTSPQTVFARAEDGALRHISRVEVGTGGLTCPDCGIELIAKPGRGGRVPHFAHKSVIECQRAGETNVHLMAKAAIAEAGGLMLPGFQTNVGGRIMTPLLPRWFNFERIEVEQAEDGFRPDLVGYAKTQESGEIRRLLIEVFVTNQVSAEKIERVKAAGESAIEIDLSKIGRDLTGPEFIKQILEEAPRRWLFHRAAYELRRKARSAAAKEDEERDKRKAFAIAREAEREEARKRARLAAPRKTALPDLNWAHMEKKRWEMLHMEGLFTRPADDSLFDVAPIVWRAWVLSILAPWRKAPYPLPGSEGLRKLAPALGKELCTRGWVKAPFVGDLRKFIDGRSHAWDPVAEAIEAYLIQGLRDYGFGSFHPGGHVDLSSVAARIKWAWDGSRPM